MVGKKLVASALCFVFLASILGFSGAVSAADQTEKENRKADITDESGSTANWGGGDYFFVKFAKDASFGVLWGNETNPNSISMLVIHSRYLGVAEVQDQNGAKIAKNMPIRVLSVYGVRLGNMIEYSDINGDGFYNGVRVGDGLGFRDYISRETVYKGVSLSTSWGRSDITRTSNETSRSYEFSLTAANLPYRAIRNGTSANGSLDEVKFTFHLTASLVYVEGVAVPHYRITVQENTGSRRLLQRYTIVGSERLSDLNYTGNHGSYNVKWDSEINGWDFDPANVANKSLLLEWKALAGYFIPEKVVEWLNVQFMQRTGGEGNATYQDSGGRVRYANPNDSDNLSPRKVMPGRYLDFGGNWTKIGRFRWVSDCTVDGKPGQMTAQVQCGRPLALRGDAGNLFVGLAVLGGFSYPGGSTILHDPGIDGAIFLEGSPMGKIPMGLILAGLILAVVAVVAIAFYMRGGKKHEGFENSYDRHTKDGKKDDEDWSEYYDRK